MKSGTRIKVVAFALMTVFLASVAVASFASASSNAAGGVYLTYAISRFSLALVNLNTAGYQTVLSITTPDCGYEAWYQVSCDGWGGMEKCDGIQYGIGVDSLSPTSQTYRHVGAPYAGAALTSRSEGLDTEGMFKLPAGTHTFNFVVKIWTTGTGFIRERSMTVTFFTDAYVSQQ